MENKGRYIYGVAASDRTVNLGPIGIGGSEVFTIPCGNFCAIVHSCPAEPYQSTDENTVKQWVKTHQGVLDEAKKELGTIVPMGFDTILQSKDDAISADQVVKDWLKEETERLHSLMEKISSRDEYGVQIFYVPRIISKRISEENLDIQKIKDEMASKSPGMAYLYKQRVEKAVRTEIERLAGDWFKDFYARVKCHCADIVVEKTKRIGQDNVMLVNLSCLVAKEKVSHLGEELEKINNTEGFSVHFSGPWPPYSFVAKPVMPVKEEVK
ncbi:MAG: GvpL/GvpF family gas vesicle protein [Candidatus Omnitrophica bacterium]|nr:GvpL/GvpF family gas vesicle protein [Candidatus Omnitrophota bacterium]